MRRSAKRWSIQTSAAPTGRGGYSSQGRSLSINLYTGIQVWRDKCGWSEYHSAASPLLRLRMRNFGPTRSMLRAVAVVLPLIAGIFSLSRAVRAGSEAEGADEARLAYSQKVSETYLFRWGKDSPFLPSLARSDNGQFMEVSAFPTSDYC